MHLFVFELGLIAAVASNFLGSVTAQTDCSCGIDSPSAGSFKCGNNIYICPGVERICSKQPSKNGSYYVVTEDQCDKMKTLAIGQDCIALPQHADVPIRALSNRVCYDASPKGFNGVKADGGGCEACKDGIDLFGPEGPLGVHTTEPSVQASGTVAPSEFPPDESIQTTACPDDIRLLKQDGNTPFPENYRGIQIIGQEPSAVTVDLGQHWTVPITNAEWSDGGGVHSVFYAFKENLFSYKCYEEENAGSDGAVFDRITIACGILSQVAHLEICVADESGTIIDSGDHAVIPKCCHPDIPGEVPTVCYHFEIQCQTQCLNNDYDALDRRLLRSGSSVS